jgi:type II secretory pathway component GspD/PulD (secretin)
MNSVNFNDPDFMSSSTYQDFINKNASSGFLSIRAYAANKALPIKGLKVIVFKILNNSRVIFFNGTTDESGIIEKIVLPAPTVSNNDEVVPQSQDYDIEATYENQKLIYKVVMYSNISVNQNINVVPNIRLDGSSYGG